MNGSSARLTLTAEQHAAVHAPDGNVAVSAGAGCGKTAVLTERYLRDLDGSSPRSLHRFVALTFTEKAAREVRKRVRDASRARLDAQEADVAYWRSILRGLEAAPIGTFHSFCARILRKHAVTAGIDPGFVILDQPIAAALRKDAIDASLRTWLAESEPDLLALAVELGVASLRDELIDLLATAPHADWKAWALRHPDEVVAEWRARWETEVVQPALDEIRTQIEGCLRLLDANECRHPQMALRREAIRDCLGVLRARNDAWEALEAIAENARVQGAGTKKHWDSEEGYEQVKNAFEALRGKIKDALASLPWTDARAEVSRQAAEHGLRIARLAHKARAAFDRKKHERGALDHDDLLRRTLALLERHAETIRADLASAFDLILVDEFQDTDPVQGRILEQLAGADLAAGRLFLVGDGKQSIYRFRGADPGIFDEFSERFEQHDPPRLRENYRSAPGIIHFINALFDGAFDGDHHLELSIKTRGLDHLNQPAVRIVWAAEGEGTKLSVDERRATEARWLARLLARGLGEGWMIRDPKTDAVRRAHAGDVAILFRSLNDSHYYERALAAEGLEYYVVGGSAFYEQQEVLDVVNVLSTIEDPFDSVALAGTLRSPFFSVSDEGLFWLAQAGADGGLTAGFHEPDSGERMLLTRPDRDRIARARDLLTRWRAQKDVQPIAGLLDCVLDESGYEPALLCEFQGARKRANVRKLVRLARQFDAQGEHGLAGFVAQLRVNMRKPPREEQAAATEEEGEFIRLMTIHQAKGLEFPIVVLPDLNRGAPNESGRLAFDSELGPLVKLSAEIEAEADSEAKTSSSKAESAGWLIHRHSEKRAAAEEALRLFYVATTRARDALILSAGMRPDEKRSSEAMGLLGRRFDLAEGRCLGPLSTGLIEPRVEVIRTPPQGVATADRPARPNLVQLARLIRRARPEPSENVGEPRTGAIPAFLDLDPALRLGPLAARADRLIRAVLSETQSLDARGLRDGIARAARKQYPVAPGRVQAIAFSRLSAWLETPLASEIAHAPRVQQALPWTVTWSTGTVCHGTLDLAMPDESGAWHIFNLALAETPNCFEQLRLLLALRAAPALGIEPVARAGHIRLGDGASIQIAESPTDTVLDEVLSECLRSRSKNCP